MEDPLMKDSLVRSMFANSTLTKNQFFAYLIKKNVVNENFLHYLRKKRKIFKTRGALGGSYLQAKNNIRQSIYTILLLFYLGIWGEKEKEVLLSLIDGLKRVSDASDDRKNDVALYISKIIENII